MAQSIADMLRTAWYEFTSGVLVFLPRLIAMLCLVFVGWLIAWILSLLLRHLLRLVRFDRLADRAGVAELLKKVALPSAPELAASMLFWLVWVAFMVSGLATLGPSGMENLIVEFVAFLPRLGVGLVILIVGMVVANFAWRATLLAAVNSDLPSARLLSGGVRWLIGTLAVVMALEQIGVAKTMMLTAFAITFGALMLGVAIAIGIGGGPIARRVLERQFPDPSREKDAPPNELSHL